MVTESRHQASVVAAGRRTSTSIHTEEPTGVVHEPETTPTIA